MKTYRVGYYSVGRCYHCGKLGEGLCIILTTALNLQGPHLNFKLNYIPSTLESIDKTHNT